MDCVSNLRHIGLNRSSSIKIEYNEDLWNEAPTQRNRLSPTANHKVLKTAE
ncbi:hypothetical protein HMPREF0972_00473 [Actinomyces sp. oral taxon 848 str. F0332]|nr:hypothetical protein HMPREF0972_00473 [Actinomyces sp. oral taxon 848 str. F0332]